MRQSVIGCVAGLALCAVSASAQEAYDTFKNGTGFNYANRYLLLPGEMTSFGFVFESQATGSVEEIAIAVLGVSQFRVELYDANDGLPGVSLGSWVATGAPAFPSTSYAALPRVNPDSRVLLTQGEQYALVIHSMSPQSVSWAWGSTFGENVLPLVEYDANGNWISSMSDAGAFKIIVPAPSALAAIGLCGLLTRRRRS